jgi:hypothetical protein
VRGEQSAELMDLRMACMDWQLDELSSLVGALSTDPDQQIAERAVDAALRLPALDECADASALLAANSVTPTSRWPACIVPGPPSSSTWVAPTRP